MHLDMLDEFHTPPPELLALTANELDALRRILEKISVATGTE
jgi:hypothetical protein